MFELIPRSTNYSIMFLMVDSTDHITGKTGLTPTVTLSKDGGSFASPSGSTSEVANGWYKLSANTTDTNTLKSLVLHASATGADPTDIKFIVVAFNPFDTMNLGLSALPNATAGGTGGLPTVDASNAVKVQSGTGANQISLSSGNVTVGTNNDKAGYALSTAGVQAVWDALSSALTTVGSIGKRLVDYLTGDIFARIGAPSGVSVSADIAAVQADTNDIQTRLPAALVGGKMDSNASVSGTVDANLISIDGAATSGNNATLNLKRFDIRNPAGDGFYVSGNGTNAAGMRIVGTGTGSDGLNVSGYNNDIKGNINGVVSGVFGNVTGNITGSVGSVSGNVGGNVTGSVGSLSTQAKSDVNTEVTSALNAWGGGGGGGGSSTLATGTVVSTTGTTTTLDSGSEAAARYYVGARLVISSGAGAGQERIITEYSIGRVATHAVWETNPDLNSTYEIQPARISLTDADGTGLITSSSALASEVAICNLALSHINVAKGIANLETEKSVEAIALRRFYDIARDNALRDYPWPFATKIASLALVQANPNDEWDYAYRYPTDCLNIRRIVSGTGDISKDLEIRYKISRDDSGILILTDQADATIEYTVRETDPTRYPADFVLAFSLQLAHYVAPVLTAGDPFKLGERSMSLYLYQIEKAKSSASNEQKDEQKIDSEFLRSRE